MSAPAPMPVRTVHLVSEAGWPAAQETLSATARGYAASVGFKPASAGFCCCRVRAARRVQLCWVSVPRMASRTSPSFGQARD